MDKPSATPRALLKALVSVLRLVARNNTGLVIGILAVAVIEGVMPTIENALRGQLINGLVGAVGSGGWSTGIMIMLGAVIIISYIAGGVDRLENYLGNMLHFRSRETFEFEIVRAKTTISLAQHEDPTLTNFNQRASDQGSSRARQFASGTIALVTALVSVIASSVAIATLYWWIFFLLLVGTLPELLLQAKFGRENWLLNHKNTEPWRLFHHMRGYFWAADSINEVKLWGAVPFFVRKMRVLFQRLNMEELAHIRKYFNLALLVSVLTQSATGFALGYFVWEVLQGNLQIGTLTFLFASILTFRGALSQFFVRSGRLYEDSLFIQELFTFFDLQPSLPQPSNPVALRADTTPHVVFENVSFTYPGREEPALKNINLVLEPGKRVALIGLNGAGKSTFVKLLCRLYDPTEGRITVNGVDLREVDLESYYKLFGVLFQDFNRYAMPIREAIAVGDVGVSIDDTRVRSAAEHSQSDAFIKGLQHGYNQMLGKNFTDGTSLSGGQWQKLAVARLFYRDPRVYVLDEPTAAIDAQSEAEIFNRLDALPKDKTVLFISHRFSTVRSADAIVVIEDGRIAEQGTHTALMRENGTYKRLFKLQADRYLKKKIE